MKRLKHGLSILTIVWGTGAFAQAPAIVQYPDMCDASAAVAVDKNLFIAASDEDNVLRVYRRDKPEQPQRIDLTSFLKLAPGSPEIDIEGAARIADVVYWIGSHGQNKNGKNRPNRHRLLATRIAVTDGEVDVTPVGAPYTKLRNDLINAPVLKKYNLLAAAKRAPESENGFNIEGLASTPDGKLLIGLRNPIPGGKGLVVSLDNPSKVMRGKKARVGSAFELTLGGRGIRSMEYSYERGRYLIVAGPFNSTGTFALYSWSGEPREDAVPIPDAVFSAGLRPEAMFFYPGETAAVQFLSDDGDDQIAGGDCKDAPVEMQRFRSFSLDIP